MHFRLKKDLKIGLFSSPNAEFSYARGHLLPHCNPQKAGTYTYTMSMWDPPGPWPPTPVSRGGTDLERVYGDVRPSRLPFHASPVVHKGPISSKRVSSQEPLLKKIQYFSLYSLNFHPNLSSQALKFGNFQLTIPQIWKFSVRKLPN